MTVIFYDAPLFFLEFYYTHENVFGVVFPDKHWNSSYLYNSRDVNKAGSFKAKSLKAKATDQG